MDRWYDTKQLTPRDWSAGISDCLSNTSLSRIGIRKGLAVCTIPTVTHIATTNKAIADTVEAILGAVYRDAVYQGGLQDANGFQVLRAVVDRLGITSRILMSYSSREWMLWRTRTSRTLSSAYFDGHHRRLLSIMDYLASQGTTISLPRNEVGHFTGVLPLNMALLDRSGHEHEKPRLGASSIIEGIWSRIYSNLWHMVTSGQANGARPQELRRFAPDTSSDPVDTLTPSHSNEPKLDLIEVSQGLHPVQQLDVDSMLPVSSNGGLSFERDNMTEKKSKGTRPGHDTGSVTVKAESPSVVQGHDSSLATVTIPSLAEAPREPDSALQSEAAEKSPASGTTGANTTTIKNSISKPGTDNSRSEDFEDFVKRTTKGLHLPTSRADWPSWLGMIFSDITQGRGQVSGVLKSKISNDPEAWYKQGRAILREMHVQDFEDFIKQTTGNSVPKAQDLWPSWLAGHRERLEAGIVRLMNKKGSVPTAEDIEAWHEEATALLNKVIQDERDETFEEFLVRTLRIGKFSWPSKKRRLAWISQRRSWLKREQEAGQLPKRIKDPDEWFNEALSLVQKDADSNQV